MKVGKKIKRMFSFKKDKPKKETTTTTNFDEQASKSETLPLDSKKRSSSLVSLRRVFSFKKEKRPTAAAGAADPASALLVTPTESNRNSYQSQTNEAAPVESSPEEKAAVEEVADIPEVTNVEKEKDADTATEEGFEVLEKTEIDEEKLKQEEEAAKEYVKLPELVEVIEAAQQLSDEVKQLELLEKKLEKKEDDEKPEEIKEEPAVLTDVITTIHDKTETAQTGNEIIRTVEIEQERTLTGDGATVLSSSTKTTTTSVAIDGVGNGHVKTEVKKEVLPPVVTRCPVTKEKNNMQIAKSNSRYPMAIACVVIAVVVAVLYGYRDARMLLTF